VSDVSVVVVTHNSRSKVPALLAALRNHAPHAEVVVVDNASSDGTAELIAREFPAVRLIARRTNVGLSAGVNEGVAATSGIYVAVLNPDIRFEADALSPLAVYLQAHAGVGVVAPKLLNDDGSLQFSCRAFPGYATALFSRYSILTRIFPRNAVSRRYLMTDFDHTAERDVDWASGAALMFPRAVFDAVGGWDPTFFLFSEDVDFCKRVHDAGYRVVYQPAVSMHHGIGISTSAAPRVVLERHKSMWRYYRKHMRGNIALDVFTAAGIAARCAYLLAAGAAKRALWRMRAKRTGIR
jgi:GT2 family glycosyltransferase